MKDVALICSVIPERFPLLRRSITTWQKSIRASGLDASICLYIEDDDLAEVLHHIPSEVPFNIQRGDKSGSHIAGYNWWQENMEAKVYLLTHGEILYPRDTIATAFANATNDTYVAFKVFWLGQQFTSELDAYNWRSPESLEKVNLLYTDDPRTHGSFYDNEGVRNIACWESSTTYAINAQTAAKLYPLPDFKAQGADDPYQAGARQRLGIKNYTVMDPILFHQWHPNSWFGSPEDAVQKAQQALLQRFGG
jgi:hypothetical protein